MASPAPSGPCWLLLIPPVPPSITIDDLRAAYGSAVALALREASRFSCTSPCVTLDISLACDKYILSNTQVPTVTYHEAQRILGLMYTLLCIISTEESIDVQFDNDVDTRVLILGTGPAEHREAVGTNLGLPRCSIHLRALAQSRRLWTRFYFIQSEIGETMLVDFLRLRAMTEYSREADVEGLPGGSTLNNPADISSSDAASSQQTLHSHYSVAVGGTFDHLHAGHKLLLTITALLLNFRDDPRREKCLTIGISGDALLQKKQYVDEMLGWNARQQGVREFILGILELSQPAEKLKSSPHRSSESDPRSIYDEFESGLVIRYAELSDPYGPTVTDESISALVLSRETRAGGRAVNEKREAQGWPLLEIFEVDVLGAEGHADAVGKENFQGKISSTDIRRRLHERSAPAMSMAGKKRQDN